MPQYEKTRNEYGAAEACGNGAACICPREVYNQPSVHWDEVLHEKYE